MKHYCKLCEYDTTILAKYLRHIQTDKHKTKIELIKKEEDLNKKSIQLINKEEEILRRNEENNKKLETIVIDNMNNVRKALEKKITKEIQHVSKELGEVKKIATKNRDYAKSTLTILNELYKDNPPLEYPGDLNCVTYIYKYYDLTKDQVLNTHKLQKALIKDYKEEKLLDVIIKILTDFLKKDNLHLQSIFNTDSSRNNYARKQDDVWKTDKAGEYLNKFIIKPFCLIIKSLMDSYLKYMFVRSEYRKKKLRNVDEESEDIFFNKDYVDLDFTDKDDTEDLKKRYLDELDDLCDIRNVTKYIESDEVCKVIIAKLSPILNYKIRIKKLEKN